MFKKTFKLKKKEKQFLLFAFFWCLILSFIFLLLLKVLKQNKSIEDLGTSFNGFVGVFVAFFGSILVYKALQSQIKANKIISDQFKIQQFESQFYEMLRLHKENVNEIEVEIVDFIYIIADFINGSGNYEKKNHKIKGRDAFIYFCNELELSYNIYKDFISKNPNEKFNFSIPYKAFFNGIDELKEDNFKIIITLNSEIFNMNYLPNFNNDKFFNVDVKAKYKIFEGHENKLGHYYRHLFHTVKFVVEQDKNFITYKEKRKYLRLLRAQLSNYEQAMLFYNYLAYAPEWEENNKFLTDYRMIHNLYDSVLIKDDFFYKHIIELRNKQNEVMSYKENDPIFQI